MKKWILLSIILAVFLFTDISLKAQDVDKEKYEKQPFQISFVPMMGTNGVNSPNVVNEFSINIIAGYAAGLDGFEVGGFANIEKAFVTGVHIAGFANYVGGDVKGVQVSGFGNINNGKMKGVQIAGFGNVNQGYTEGIQLAGFANINGEGIKAIQIAGFGNFNKGHAGEVQIAGFANINQDYIEGIQVAGFANINGKGGKALQVAGFANILKDDFTGIQVSGFLNTAKKVEGIQLGFLNFCDSIDGLPIGFLSIVKNGYRAFEIWGSDALNVNFGFNIGVRRFYNIFSIGIHPAGGKFLWAYGFGIGSLFYLNPETTLSVEGMSYHINEREWWTNRLNLLNQLRFNFGIDLSGESQFFIGPTYNVFVSREDPLNNIFGSDIAPYAFFDKTRKKTNVKMWVGINAGFRF